MSHQEVLNKLANISTAEPGVNTPAKLQYTKSTIKKDPKSYQEASTKTADIPIMRPTVHTLALS